MLKKKNKKYVQFSKKVVLLCIINLFIIEAFTMFSMVYLKDISSISYLVTAIAAECLGCVIWYMKNSEAEKKARIQAYVDIGKNAQEYDPDNLDTFYRGNGLQNDPIEPSVTYNTSGSDMCEEEVTDGEETSEDSDEYNEEDIM